MSGIDLQSLSAGGVTAGIITAIGAYVKDRRKTKADVDRAEALLPMDLVHQATTVASGQMQAMAAEMTRLRGRLADSEAEADRLREQLRQARTELDAATGHLRQMWLRLADVDPTMPRPDWLDE